MAAVLRAASASASSRRYARASAPRAVAADATPARAANAAGAEEKPLLVRAALGEEVERPPAWMMRQAGRYMQAYRDLAKKHPGFRERSETTDLIVDISLQPYNAFRPDGVILFSDILTPFPGIGIPFEIDDEKGPLLENPIRTMEQVKGLHALDLSGLGFIEESLKALRAEVGNSAAVLGFVGSPWTLATYVVEGKSTSTYKIIKTMAFQQPEVLHAILGALADALADYIRYQIDSGAHAIQIFDSWGGQLPPAQWDELSRPYLERMVKSVRESHPGVPLTLYANGSGGLLERMGQTGVDVIGLDWTIDMADGRARLGDGLAVQGNVDPAVLFAPEAAVRQAVRDCCAKAGPRGHVLNLGHGVLVGTPEENVAAFFDEVRSLSN